MIARNWPVWRQTKSRPSGENAIAVGCPERLPPNSVSVNPVGKLAAVAGEQPRISGTAKMNSKIALKPEFEIEKEVCDFTVLNC